MVSQLRREIAGVDANHRRRYIRRFTQEFRDYEDLTSWDDLVLACYKADLTYIGDYHALISSQALAARLLREIASRSREVILAVEMVYGRDQRTLDRWMAGDLTEAEFLRRLRYDVEWGYDWEGFSQIFAAARDYGVRVFGIDCPPRNGLKYIRRRDQYAAERIADIFVRNPGSKVAVVIGESHLATSHLPARVRAALAAHNLEKRSVRVVQNVDEIYWKLVARGHEQRDVVAVTRQTFCVFNASPVAKYESYRQTINRWNAESIDEEQVDLTPTIYTMIDTILRFLEVDKYRLCVRREGECIKFLVDCYPDVHSSADGDALSRAIAGGGVTRAEAAEIRRHIARHGSCYIPRINAIVIGRFSMVHGGEEASRFVNHALRGDAFYGEPRHRSRDDLFYGAVLNEALGYFGSKLIDPSRNHFFETKLYQYHRKDRSFIEANTDYTFEEFSGIIRFILTHKRFETSRIRAQMPPEIKAGIWTRKSRIFSVLKHELGYYLGQQLYDGYQQGTIQREEIRTLYSMRFTEGGAALATYLDLAGQLQGAAPRKRKATSGLR